MEKLVCCILLAGSGLMALIEGTEVSSYVWAIICFVIVAVDIFYKKNLSVYTCIVLLAVVWIPVVLYLDRRKRKQREKQARRELRKIAPWWYW